MKKFGCVLVLLCFFGVSLQSLSQTLVTTGVVRGVARDASGALVPGANIVLLAGDTGQTSARTTNDVGIFVFPSQPVGNYRMEVTASGFRTECVENVAVQV